MACRNALAAVLVVLCLTLAACGGSSDGPPSKAETVKKANSICAAANARVEKGFDTSSDSQAREGVISQAKVRYPVAKATLARMRDLDPPATGARQWKAFVSAQADAVAALEKLVGGGTETALSLGPELRTVEQTVRTTGDQTKATATVLGASRCVAGPYKQTLQGVAVKDQPPEFGAGTTRLETTIDGASMSFGYPANWHKKTVDGAAKDEQSVAYGDDDTNCIAAHDKSDYRGSNSSRKDLVAYANRQIKQARDGADSYKLYRVGPAIPEGSPLQGIYITRRSVSGADVRNGRLAFLFSAKRGSGGRDRFIIDCETTDSKHFDALDENVFFPLVQGFDGSYSG